MNPCKHLNRRYTRRVFSNGSTHICVQCLDCLNVVKLPEHGDRPFLRLDEVPFDQKIHEWIDPSQVQGELI